MKPSQKLWDETALKMGRKTLKNTSCTPDKSEMFQLKNLGTFWPVYPESPKTEHIET